MRRMKVSREKSYSRQCVRLRYQVVEEIRRAMYVMNGVGSGGVSESAYMAERRLAGQYHLLHDI